MRRRASVAKRSTARPARKASRRHPGTEQPAAPKRRSLQPPKYRLARIDDLLGDFSEQTGATFG